MNPISSLAANSGFFEVFSAACAMFYIGYRVLIGINGRTDADIFRRFVGWSFYILGLILIFMSLSKLANHADQRNAPQIEKKHAPSVNPDTQGKEQMPEHEKNQQNR